MKEVETWTTCVVVVLVVVVLVVVVLVVEVLVVEVLVVEVLVVEVLVSVVLVVVVLVLVLVLRGGVVEATGEMLRLHTNARLSNLSPCLPPTTMNELDGSIHTASAS
jgi:hypothetical protein